MADRSPGHCNCDKNSADQLYRWVRWVGPLYTICLIVLHFLG